MNRTGTLGWGTWVYVGSTYHEDGRFIPAEPAPVTTWTFSSDGIAVESCGSDTETWNWDIDSQSRLHLWTEGDSATSSKFFFRSGKLYIEGDSAWDEYRPM
ncbi:MAG: hypothetical protein AB2L09_08415 [Coriobacteriia bacterium]